MEVKELVEGRHCCTRCVKLSKRMNDETEKLMIECAAFHTLCFEWPENQGVPLWKQECWGFCGSQDVWMDTLDTIAKENARRMRAYKSNRRLTRKEAEGWQKVYHEETHPHLLKPPRGEPSESKRRISKKTPLLDGDPGDWRFVGAMAGNMKEYDSIEQTKKADRKKARDLTGKRKVKNKN